MSQKASRKLSQDDQFILLAEIGTGALTSDQRAVEVADLLSGSAIVAMAARKLLPGRESEVQYRIIKSLLSRGNPVSVAYEAMWYAQTLKSHWVAEDLVSLDTSGEVGHMLATVFRMATTWGRERGLRDIAAAIRDALPNKGARISNVFEPILEAVPEVSHYIGFDIIGPVLWFGTNASAWKTLEYLWDAEGLGSKVATELVLERPDFERYALGLLGGMPIEHGIDILDKYGDSVVKRIPPPVLAGWLEIMSGRLALEVNSRGTATPFKSFVRALNVLRHPRYQSVTDMRPLLQSLSEQFVFASESELETLIKLETQGLVPLPLPLVVVERLSRHPNAQVRQALVLHAGGIDIRDRPALLSDRPSGAARI